MIDPERLEIKWHVPNDEETSCAISLFKNAVESKLERIKSLIQTDSSTSHQKRSSADWTDELRESLKFLVSSLLASIPLYQRCPHPQAWEVNDWETKKVPQMPPSADGMDLDPVDADEEDAGDDDDDDDANSDAITGRAHKYADGFIGRPLPTESVEVLIAMYKSIGGVLQNVARYLNKYRPDDMQAFIELSTVRIQIYITKRRLFIPGYTLREWRR